MNGDTLNKDTDIHPPGPMTGLTEADIHAQDAASEADPHDEEPYPEHSKLSQVKQRSQAIGDFLEWLQSEKKLTICQRHVHTTDCYNMGLSQKEFAAKYGRSGDNIASASECVLGRFNVAQCAAHNGEYFAAHVPTEKLLAEHFGVNLDKLEEEKRAMLEEFRRDF